MSATPVRATTELGRVVSLIRYPVSSLAGEYLTEVQVGERGLEGDRRVGLFDAEIGTHIYPVRDARWNGAPLIHARLREGTPELSMDGESWAGMDRPGTLESLSERFGAKVALRRYDDTSAPRYKVAPLHLLSLQALDALRRHLPGSQIDERRFRPNILVDLPDMPGDIPEYGLLGREFTLGGLRLRGTAHCKRCGFVTLAMDELPLDNDVIRTILRRYERNFGIYCEVVEPARLHVGDVLSADPGAADVGPIVIVGAGQAGAMAAKALRRLGYEGMIRLIGDEREPPYERPPLSKQISKNTELAAQRIMTPIEAEELGIDLALRSQVASLNLERRIVEKIDGETIAFGTLLLATGGMARTIPGLARGHGRIHVLRNLDDARELSRILHPDARIGVLGGGWIGMEIAAVARQKGADVTLMARDTRLAPRILPDAVSAELMRLHRDRGVSVRFGCTARFRETANGVECVDGSDEITFDHLVIAIGMVPNDGLARRAGLDCDDGIMTDADGATGDPRVFAIGDVARQPQGRIESWQNANAQAERAARRILSLEPAAPEPLRFWSEQYDRRLQIVGRPDPDAVALSQKPGRFWDFGSFAIGLDAPDDVHRFARSLIRVRSSLSPAAEPLPDAGDLPRREEPLCAAAELIEGALIRIDHPGHGPLAVTRQHGRAYATDDRCPHAVASLATGFVEDGRIICPLHFAEFSLQDGAPFHAPDGCPRLAVHPVIERNGQLYVHLPARMDRDL